MMVLKIVSWGFLIFIIDGKSDDYFLSKIHMAIKTKINLYQ